MSVPRLIILMHMASCTDTLCRCGYFSCIKTASTLYCRVYLSCCKQRGEMLICLLLPGGTACAVGRIRGVKWSYISGGVRHGLLTWVASSSRCQARWDVHSILREEYFLSPAQPAWSMRRHQLKVPGRRTQQTARAVTFATSLALHFDCLRCTPCVRSSIV